jgi:hypothetical protein
MTDGNLVKWQFNDEIVKGERNQIETKSMFKRLIDSNYDMQAATRLWIPRN